MSPTGLEVSVSQPILLLAPKGDGFWPHWGTRPCAERDFLREESQQIEP